jgi:hypothetical protein
VGLHNQISKITDKVISIGASEVPAIINVIVKSRCDAPATIRVFREA